MKACFAAITILLVLESACNRNSPQSLAEQMKHLGVYAQTSSGVLELTSYGVEQTQDSIMDGMSVVFQFPDTGPQAGKAAAFFVNMPDAVITESEIYLLPNPIGARWYAPNDKRTPSPIKASIENVTGAIYKVTPGSMPPDAAGFLCLHVKMPNGTPDRLYAIKLER